MDQFAKREISLRYWLLGRGYTRAVEALEFAKGLHTGLRRDGVTPVLDHQVTITLFVRCLDLIHPEDTLVTCLLHDTREDHGVDDAFIRARFGDRAANAVEAMTKEFRGVKKDPRMVMEQTAADPCASVAKGGDRRHNLATMETFTREKQLEQVAETRELILPGLKLARRNFPRQEPAYEVIKHVILGQLELLEAVNREAA